MDYSAFNGMDLAYPEDIASKLIDNLSDLCSAGYIDEDIDNNNRADLEEDLTKALIGLQTIANNEYNGDYWRTFYKVLSDLSEVR